MRVKRRRVTAQRCGVAIAFMLSATTLAHAQSIGVLPYWVIRYNREITWLIFLGMAYLTFRWWKNRNGRTSRVGTFAVVDDGFKVTPSVDGKSIRFEIKGAGIGVGAWIGFIIAGAFFGFFFSFFMYMIYRTKDPQTFANFGLFFAACLVIAFAWDRIRKQQFVFEVGDSSVRAPDGQLFAKAEISEILLRNQGATAHSAAPQSTTIIAGTGLTGVAMAGANAMNNASASVGNAIGQSVAQSIAKRGNEVCIRHGRKVIPLARYLREDDAIGLFNKVRELI